MALLLGLTLVGCGAATRQGPAVELDPTHVVVLGEGASRQVFMGDERELFEQAVDEFNRANWLAALRLYDKLLALYPDSINADLMRYNRGVIVLTIEDFRSAVADFRFAAEHADRDKDRRDARFQLAVALMGMEDWWRASELLEALLSEGELREAGRVEALVRAGICHQRAARFFEAERSYKEAVRLYRNSSDLYLQYNTRYPAMAQYQIGDLYAELFARIRFRLPLERMKEDLEDKSSLFLKSQHAFLRTIRMKNAYWGLAAGFRIGALYEAFFQDLQDAEVPRELDEEELAVYLEELHRHIRPLVERAITVYKKNLEMAARLGAENEWIERSEESLGKLQRLVGAKGLIGHRHELMNGTHHDRPRQD